MILHKTIIQSIMLHVSMNYHSQTEEDWGALSFGKNRISALSVYKIKHQSAHYHSLSFKV